MGELSSFLCLSPGLGCHLVGATGWPSVAHRAVLALGVVHRGGPRRKNVGANTPCARRSHGPALLLPSTHGQSYTLHTLGIWSHRQQTPTVHQGLTMLSLLRSRSPYCQWWSSRKVCSAYQKKAHVTSLLRGRELHRVDVGGDNRNLWGSTSSRRHTSTSTIWLF